MKQAGYSKQARGRSFERRQSPKHANGEVGDFKARNNPQQIIEKYLNLAQDAASSGDPVSAENYFQYADHYHRIASANRLARPPERQRDSNERTRPLVPDMEGQEERPSPPPQENS